MKIALLARNPSLYTHRRICEAARERGHEIEVVNTLRVSINITSRKPTLYYRKRKLEGFDAVIMMWSAFGVLESDEEDQKVLYAVARALRPGGRFLIEQTSREHVVRHFQAHDWYQLEGGTLVLHERELDLLESRNYVRMTVIEPDGSRRKYDHTFRFYTLTELVEMLGRAGLTYRAVWGDFDGSPYTLESLRMIVMAEKSGGQSRDR